MASSVRVPNHMVPRHRVDTSTVVRPSLSVRWRMGLLPGVGTALATLVRGAVPGDARRAAVREYRPI
ncbi:hypothetical protein GCM10023113_05780 [Cellulomonas oligotrophica]